MGLLEAFTRALHAAPADADVVQEARLAALSRARDLGIPDTRHEDWKYTDLTALTRQEFQPAPTVALDESTLPLASLAAYRVVFVNGGHSARLSTAEALPAGATMRTLREIATQDPAWIAGQLGAQGTAVAKVFPALNAAGACDGLSLEIGPDVHLDRPLLVMFVGASAAAPTLSAPHLRVRAGARSSVSIVEVHVNQGEEASLANAYTRIETADGANVRHYRVVCDAAAATHVGQVQLLVGAHSQVENFSLVLGGRLTRVDIDCDLAAAGGSVLLNGVFLAGPGSHVDHHTRVDHRASHTTSDEVYRGIADGNGRGVFNGKIVVAPGVEKVVATQASHNLLLSSDAEIDTKPELEIYADDLRCSHGATVGQLDEDALFYLRARGVPEAEARALLLFGFVQNSLEAIPYPELQSLVAARFAADNAALGQILAGAAA